MTTLSRFSRQSDAGLRALNVVLWENLVLVVFLVLESKGPYWKLRVNSNSVKLWNAYASLHKIPPHNVYYRQ